MEEQRVVNAASSDPGYADIKTRQGLTRPVFLLTIMFLTIIGAFYCLLHQMYFNKAASFEWVYIFVSSGSADVHRMGTLCQAASTLLMSGITLTAPIFSLSLSQVFDTVFNVADKTLHASKESESREKKMERYKELIRNYTTTYKRPNDIYLSIWCTSVITLACKTISFCVNFGWPEVVFVEGLFFILINMLLCTLFALTAFWFFVMVRPGETKLHLYQMYFDI